MVPTYRDENVTDCQENNDKAGHLEERLEGEADQVPLPGGVQAELLTAQCGSVLQQRGVGEGDSFNTADIRHQVWVVAVGRVVNGRYGRQGAQVCILYDENIL